MTTLASDSERAQLERLRGALEQARRQRRLLTYLEAADAISIEPPHRIHKLTLLLELMMEADAVAGRPLLAATVVSRARSGLPAPGFFDKAKALGLFDGRDSRAFHNQLLAQLYDANGNPDEP